MEDGEIGNERILEHLKEETHLSGKLWTEDGINGWNKLHTILGKMSEGRFKNEGTIEELQQQMQNRNTLQ